MRSLISHRSNRAAVTALTLPVTLNKDTDCWFCAAPVATGNTVASRTMSPPIHGNIFGADATSPLSGKSLLGIPVLAQFAVTAGTTFPATLPAIAAAHLTSGTSGGMIPAFLTGTAS